MRNDYRAQTKQTGNFQERYPEEVAAAKRISVLTEYRNGDYDRRLHLFFSYRDLREEFAEIDKLEFDAA